MKSALLRVDGLGKDFVSRGAQSMTRAVDGVNLSLDRGEILSLVGESGCGKTTLARLVLGLEVPTRGTIWFDGEEIEGRRGLRQLRRSGKVQAVFQDPWSSLNPRKRIMTILSEPMRIMGVTGKEAEARATELLLEVGLDTDVLSLFPHQLSGGMRQRVAIARALAVRPKLIVLDEPVSALDVSVRGQIMNLLKRLAEDFNVSYLMIAHDFGTVRFMSHRVAVMYLGRIVESGPAETLFQSPRHPYTASLMRLSGVESRDGVFERFPHDMSFLSREAISPTGAHNGCAFANRCPVANLQDKAFNDRALESTPMPVTLDGDHLVACHLYDPTSHSSIKRTVTSNDALGKRFE